MKKKQVEQALDAALDAAERANTVAEASAEAINALSKSFEALVELLTEEEPEYELTDAGLDALADGLVAGFDPNTGAFEGVDSLDGLEDNPVYDTVPEISGEEYPEYTTQAGVLREAGVPEHAINIPVMHVYPYNDLYKHVVDKHICWCNPVVAAVAGTLLVTHVPADGREPPKDTLTDDISTAAKKRMH